MFEAFRVGPVVTAQGTATLYAACSPSGVTNAIAADDRAGLLELRSQAPSGQLACEPALASAGRPLGFRPAPLSADAARARAAFAMMLLYGPSVEQRAVSRFEQLIEVARRFVSERPWQLVRPEVPVEITIEAAGQQRQYAVSVLGADGIEHGIALHESAEALGRFVALAAADRFDEMRRCSVRSLTVSAEPDWSGAAIAAAFGQPLVVVPTATGPTGPRTVTCDDLSELAAAMFAITKLGPGRYVAEVTVDTEPGQYCRATARIADRAAVSTRPLPAWAKQAIRVSGEVPRALLAVPVLPVSDLDDAVAGLRALGFEVTETTEPRSAMAAWPGMVLELVHAPSSPGAACHVVVESIDALAAIWRAAGVPLQTIEHENERVLLLEVPGGLHLTIGEVFPHGYRPANPTRVPRQRRKPRPPA